jgi:hypothetical protein
MKADRRPSPKSVEEALSNAAHHARNALAEGVAAARSLLDAGSLVATRDASAESPTLASVARLLDELEAHLASPSRASSAAAPILNALSEALEAEIARWEARAAHDADARAVLRAFIGLREVLWEVGVRSSGSAGASAASDPPPASRQKKRNSNVTYAQTESTHSESGPRVQRVRVRG